VNTAIEVFEHEEFGQVRTLTIDDEPWFVAKDVAVALGYSDTDQATRKHCKNAVLVDVPSIRRGVQQTKVIQEPDVYRLISRSRLPGAERFMDWVFEVVLPTIRRTGQFSATPEELDYFPTILPAWDTARALAERNGYRGNQAILTANKTIKRRYDLDIPEILGGTNLLSDHQERYLTATEIGEMVGLNPRAVNRCFEEMGLHTSGRDRRDRLTWTISEWGKDFAVLLDVGKAHSDGSPVQQTKWREGVVIELRDFLSQ